MADNNFRAFRPREPVADDGFDLGTSDPLAELARLIGQSDPVGESGRGARRDAESAYVDVPVAAGGEEWPAEESYEPDDYADERPVQPRLPEPYPSSRAYAPNDRAYEHEAAAAEAYPAPAEAFDDDRGHLPMPQARFPDVRPPAPFAGRELPALPPQSRDEDHGADRWHEGPAVAPYAPDPYEDEAPSSVRRSGYVVILAVLSLAALGVAGAFGYHSMFGGSVLPSLPPIIKAGDGPNKIVPGRGDTQADAASPGSGSSAAGEKLVSREEQPLNMQPPLPAPRVVSTIPVMPPAGVVPQGAPPAIAPVQAAPAPAPVAAPAPPPSPAAAVVATEPKKIHTVIIRPDQPGSAPEPAAPPAPKISAPRQTAAIAPRPAAPPQSGANAPLALVSQGGEAPAPAPARTRVARAEASDAPHAAAPAQGGGYAVQVTSQRSEAEAQAAFRSLRAKFPSQLGNREPIIRRADLGDKGTYYRAMVGPFASAEAAAGLCSNLKSAGGTCIVQRN